MKAVDVADLKIMLAGEPQPTLINTLPKEQFSQTRIPGSINIPQDQDDFVKRVEIAVGDRDQPVVVYCASHECDSSTNAAQKLDDAGFSDVYDFEEGAKGWQQAGEPLRADLQPPPKSAH